MSLTSSRYQKMDDWISSDFQFDLVYPVHIQKLARKHWTPLNITKQSVEFLAIEEGVKILDIGSGVGKFCLSASCYKPLAFFDGIEQRESLVEIAQAAQSVLGLPNVSFTHGNFTQTDFSQYNHFYFYNSFFENIDKSDKIDETIEYSSGLYQYYSDYLYKELENRPQDTRVVTYCSWGDEIPPSYTLVDTAISGLLKFYVKE